MRVTNRQQTTDGRTADGHSKCVDNSTRKALCVLEVTETPRREYNLTSRPMQLVEKQRVHRGRGAARAQTRATRATLTMIN